MCSTRATARHRKVQTKELEGQCAPKGSRCAGKQQSRSRRAALVSLSCKRSDGVMQLRPVRIKNDPSVNERSRRFGVGKTKRRERKRRRPSSSAQRRARTGGVGVEERAASATNSLFFPFCLGGVGVFCSCRMELDRFKSVMIERTT